MKLEGILIGNEQTGLYFPFSDNDEDDYIIIKTTGLNDSTFSHHESDVKHIFSAKEDKEIGLSVAVKPAALFVDLRRHINSRLPIGVELDFSILAIKDNGEKVKAQTKCKLKMVAYEFTTASPKLIITLETKSPYVEIGTDYGVELAFGMSADLEELVDDYSSVLGYILLDFPTAMIYKIKLDQHDWLTIHMSRFPYVFGEDILTDESVIEFNSNPENFYIRLKTPGKETVDIETICEMGPYNFRFPPNSYMFIETSKIPSSAVTKDAVSIIVERKLSGV